MQLYRIQRQPLDADIFDESSWRTVVTLTDWDAAERMFQFMQDTHPEYGWAKMFDRI